MLHYQILGRGKPILILHGITQDHRYMVDALEPAFDGIEGWQRIYVDLPGHGLSPARSSIQSQDDLLQAVVDFADDRFHDTPFSVIGLSRGSYIARGLMYLIPDRISGAALIVAGGNPSSDPGRLPPHEVLVHDPETGAGLPADERWAFDNISVVQTREIAERRRRTTIPARKLFDPVQEARVFASFDFSFATDEETSVFEKPSLVVAGRQDSISGYLDSMDIFQRLPRASLAVLDTAGHALAWERPDLFTALIRDWLDRVDTGLSDQ